MSKPVHPQISKNYQIIVYLFFNATFIINNLMPVEINKVDTLQTRIFNSFVNLTKEDSSLYPAITTVRIEPNYLGGTAVDLLTSYTIYDQYAIRISTP